MGRKTPKTAHYPWDFTTVLEEDRAMDTGNTRTEQLVKIARVVPEMRL